MMNGNEARQLLLIAHRILAQTFMGDCPLYVTCGLNGWFTVWSFGKAHRRVRLNVERDPQHGWMFREVRI